MKNLVVYYTWKGNTEVVAKEISKSINGQLIKIEEVNQRGGFVSAALSAIIGLKSKIKPISHSMDEYDNIFIGGQIWAGHSTPAINAFVNKTDFKGKRVFLFITQANNKEPANVIKSITERVKKHGGNVAKSFFIQTLMESVITPEAVKQPISDWLKIINIK